MTRPELSEEDQAHVEAFRAAPTEVALSGHAQVFAAAYSLNWDDHGGAPRILLQHPDCELATALVLFWHGGAGDLLAECRTAEEADEEFYLGAGTEFTFLVEVHDAVASGRITRGSLVFDPRDDDGTDWTGGEGPDDFVYAVDAKLFGA